LTCRFNGSGVELAATAPGCCGNWPRYSTVKRPSPHTNSYRDPSRPPGVTSAEFLIQYHADQLRVSRPLRWFLIDYPSSAISKEQA